ncbi:MAG: FecR domain-containing protein [Bacteroidetes bacterium]|nr:FecR domain-containing protein [Bacteroidota bacterium]
MLRKDRFVYLFGRYMDKTCTAAERAEFMTCVAQPEYEALLRGLLRGISSGELPHYEQPLERADAIFESIVRPRRAVVAEPEAAEQPVVSTGGTGRRTVLRSWRYAAVFLIAAATGLTAYYYSSRKQASPVAMQQDGNDTLSDRSAGSREAIAAVSETAHRYIKLPDGSKVLLNSGSKLSYAPAFGVKREVYLEGEGYFDIKQDATRPFIVHAGRIKTVVLGTAFNVRALPGGEQVVVTVASGKVRVENGQRTLGVLMRDEQLTVSGSDDIAAKQSVKPDEMPDWKAEDILFDDMPVGDAVAELEKRFSVHIVLGNTALADYRVSASFLHHETVEQILKVLCGINHMEYQLREKDVYVIYKTH